MKGFVDRLPGIDGTPVVPREEPDTLVVIKLALDQVDLKSPPDSELRFVELF